VSESIGDYRRYFRSANKFLIKKGLVSREKLLTYGSYLKARKLSTTFEVITGYCIGSYAGSNGVTLGIAFDNEAQFNCSGPVIRQYEYRRYHRLRYEYAMAVDWQCILEVSELSEGPLDTLAMLTSGNPYIRELGQKVLKANVDE
jgi:hypothetical protein